jgi:hypothetical protein
MTMTTVDQMIDMATTPEAIPGGLLNPKLVGLLEEHEQLEEAQGQLWQAHQDAQHGVNPAVAEDATAFAVARRAGSKDPGPKKADAARKLVESTRRELDGTREAVSAVKGDVLREIEASFDHLAGNCDATAGEHRARALALLGELELEVRELVVAERVRGWLSQPVKRDRLAPFVKWSRTWSAFADSFERVRGEIETRAGRLPRQRYIEPSVDVEGSRRRIESGDLLAPKPERQTTGAAIVADWEAERERIAADLDADPNVVPSSKPERVGPEEGALRAGKAERQAQGAAIAHELATNAAQAVGTGSRGNQFETEAD